VDCKTKKESIEFLQTSSRVSCECLQEQAKLEIIFLYGFFLRSST
jgi:hypothetical protein